MTCRERSMLSSSIIHSQLNLQASLSSYDDDLALALKLSMEQGTVSPNRQQSAPQPMELEEVIEDNDDELKAALALSLQTAAADVANDAKKDEEKEAKDDEDSMEVEPVELSQDERRRRALEAATRRMNSNQ